MPVTVRIPTPLRPHAGGARDVQVQAKNVGEAVHALVRAHPDLGRHLLDEKGAVRSFVNLYLNQQDVRALQNLDTPAREGDVLVIVPAVAGGA